MMIDKDKIIGLNFQEVETSRLQHGTNELTKQKRKSFFSSLLSNFADPMVGILIVALIINIILLLVNIANFQMSELLEPIGIAFAILIAVTVSTISEYGSESAFKKLQEEADRITCRVKRADGTKVIPIAEVVIGDIIILQAGDKIPADGILASGSIEVDQSSLNGESKEASKYFSLNNIKDPNKEGDFLHPMLLFCGTVVTSGEALMRVTSIGDSTFYGKLAQGLQENPPESPLKAKLRRLAKTISKIGYIGASLAAISFLFHAIIIQNDFNGANIMATLSDFSALFPILLSAITLATTIIVMAVPEGLPMMITVVLSSNMRRMLKDKVLVRKLGGIETAGSMNILFTDKTGTLTLGKPIVTSFITGEGKILPHDYFNKNRGLSAREFSNYFLDILSLSLKINNAAEIVDGIATGGNLTDRSLLNYAHSLPFNAPNVQVLKKIPFSSNAKFMATKVSGNIVNNSWLVKGAPEKIISACAKTFDKDGNIVLFNSKDKIKTHIKDLADRAIRVIALAVSHHEIVDGKELNDLIFIGLIGVRDEIRSEAIQGVQEVKGAGIQVVMITGDSKDTAAAVALETGILDNKGQNLILTSDELHTLSDYELKLKLPNLRVIARALPQDKSRLVKIAQSLDLVVGMTGDGVNDAPALKKADIGFAMGSGTEVAKEAGDIVILDDNINSIAKAVSYGRTIYKSIRKFIIFQLTSNLGAIAISIVAPLVGLREPITVIQILWMNLIMDSLAGLAFAGEKPKARYMLEKPKKRNEPIINRYMLNQMIIGAIATAGIAFFFLNSNIISVFFARNTRGYLTGDYFFNYHRAGFFAMFMFMALFNTLNVRTHEINLFKGLKDNKPFLLIIGGVSLVQVFITYFGGSIFRTEALLFRHLAVVLSLAALIIPIDIIRKLILKALKKQGRT
ncbi:MAG: calcium-translocating P-type ATPase, PMCA-type [Firmicutes bacterium]|nr:calcium-translocating P-type ATPase, PMCA-type [Bacillota bacterium]